VNSGVVDAVVVGGAAVPGTRPVLAAMVSASLSDGYVMETTTAATTATKITATAVCNECSPHKNC